MKQEKNRKRVVFLQLFCIFFLLIAFVLTSSMVLFLKYLGASMGIDFAQSDIQLAAVVTFGNVFMLSLVCTAVDLLRRKLTVERPVKRSWTAISAPALRPCAGWSRASMSSLTTLTGWCRSFPAWKPCARTLSPTFPTS